jgi:hypothetical protein
MRVSGQRDASSLCSSERSPIPIVQEAECALEPVWPGVEKRKSLATTRVLTPNSPARNVSLNQLRYPGPYRYCLQRLGNFGGVMILNSAIQLLTFLPASYLVSPIDL